MSEWSLYWTGAIIGGNIWEISSKELSIGYKNYKIIPPSALWCNECNFIPIYIQQDATLHSLLYKETALHVSGGTPTHRQECRQLYLQHLVFVRPLLLPAASGR